MDLEEQERAAYASGDIDRAALLARIVELEAQVEDLNQELEDARDESLAAWEAKHGSADDYKAFFYGCFERLRSSYPCPNVSSDYDKAVIFNIIDHAEENDI